MTPVSSMLLLPTWGIALAIAFTTARLSRKSGFGLVVLCIVLGGWLTGLILLENGMEAWAEAIIPSGMLLAGAFEQADWELRGRGPGKRRVLVGWVASGAVAAFGPLAPRLLYGPGARGAGVAFFPLAVVATVATVSFQIVRLQRALTAPVGKPRTQARFFLAASILGALGGGGAIALHITGLAPAGVAAPFLVGFVAMIFGAVWTGEDAAGRRLLTQGFFSALIAALVSTPLVKWLADPPLSVAQVFWLVLPFDPLRQLITDAFLERVFPKSIAVRSLTAAVEREEARAEHAERLAALGRMASAVAHEVRNPLGVILAELKVLEATGSERESLEAIRGQVRRASLFIDDLLRYAKPRPLEPREIDLSAVAATGASLAMRALGLDRAQLPSTPGPRIEADEAALTDVVRNLVANALIATEGTQAIVVVRVHEAPHVEISVEDDGPGVPPEVLPRLFEAFATGRGRDERHPGTGLGLAICKSLVERHGGTLRHERPAGGGARFVVRLPR